MHYNTHLWEKKRLACAHAITLVDLHTISGNMPMFDSYLSQICADSGSVLGNCFLRTCTFQCSELSKEVRDALTLLLILHHIGGLCHRLDG